MKKALALVLALVLALSMAVSASAELIELAPDTAASAGKDKIFVVDIDPDNDNEAQILYTRPFMPYWNYVNDEKLTDSYVTYIALDPTVAYKDIVLTATGILDAELVKYDPEKMEADGALNLTYCVMHKGKVLEAPYTLDEVAEDVYLEAIDAETDILEIDHFTGWSYNDAQTLAKLVRDDMRVSKGVVDVACEQNVNIIKLTVDNNFTRAFTKGTLKIDAVRVADKKAVTNTITVINDVTIFEYEEVKYAAENNAKGAYLQLGDNGYSDFFTSEYGYSYIFGDDYDEEENRQDPFALVVSTTAFRAIEGKDLTLNVFDVKDVGSISVTLKDIVKGQKGINFFAWADYTFNDKDDDDKKDANEAFETISFGFKGNQVVNGEFEVDLEFPISYYNLREAFGKKVEEEDIITYYVLKNGKAFDSFTVDYMTDDVNKNVELTIKGENEELGWYTLALEVPAEETEVEENPNTGAESVVGVVAALAVVSVATAAAVSLKK